MLLLQSFLALGLVFAGLGVFMLLRWADRLEAPPVRATASVHPFTPRSHAPGGGRRAA